MKKTSLLNEKKSKAKGKYALLNTYARAGFRGKVFYQKRCYHCREMFLAVRQDALACPVPSCQVAISRRIANGQPLRLFADAPEEPGRAIDFVKWGMEAPGLPLDQEPDGLHGLNTLRHQELIRNILVNLNFRLYEANAGVYVLSEMPVYFTETRYRIPDLVAFDKKTPVFALEIYDEGGQTKAEKVREDLIEVENFYYYGIQQNLLIDMSTGIENALGKIKVAGKEYDFDSIKADPREILPITWGKIGELENSIGGLKQQVGGLEQKVSGLEQKVSGLEQKVGGLKQDVSGLKQDVNEIKSLIKLLLEK